jgi:hypothetical protein
MMDASGRKDSWDGIDLMAGGIARVFFKISIWIGRVETPGGRGR